LTDHDYEMQKIRIKGLVEKWVGLLDIRHWSIEVIYSRSPIECEEGWICQPQTLTQWCYLASRMTFNLPAVSDISDRVLSSTILHELLHMLVNEMREEGIKHEERVVTQLEKSIINLSERLQTPF
jgi:hypothetical protein